MDVAASIYRQINIEIPPRSNATTSDSITLDAHFRATPLEGQATENERKEYQCKTGSILYAAIVSRPDIAFAASLLCQFNANPSREHLREADRTLGYLAHTKDYALEYYRYGLVETARF